jgi:hypothetical protein
MFDLPPLGLDPFLKQVPGLSSGLGQQDSPARPEVISPESFERLPLSALVQDVRPEDEIEFLIKPVGLPIEPAGVNARGLFEAVKLGKQ